MTTGSPQAHDESTHHDAVYASDEYRLLAASPLFRAHRERVLNRVILPALRSHASYPNARVLSLGSGDGKYERDIAPHAASVLGLEISAVAVNAAMARSDRPPNVSFMVGDAREADAVPGGPFDVILAIAILHHFPGPEIQQALERAARALSPGGMLVSVDPSARRLVALLKPLVPGAIARHHSPDEAEVDPDGLAAHFSHAGFSRVRIQPFDFAAGPLAWLAPQIPSIIAQPLVAMDSLLASTPVIGRWASGFAIVARTSTG